MSSSVHASIGRAPARTDHATWRDLALLLALTLAVRLVVFLLTNNENGDPDARAAWGATIFEDPSLITSGFWLPFHPYVIALAMFPISNPVDAGRMVSLVAGVLAVVPFFAVVRDLFDRRTAMLASSLFAIYGCHVGLSVVVMTETPFVLFTLVGLWCFLREMRSSRPGAAGFLLAGALLSIAGGFRHEAWQFTGLLMLWMFWDPRTRRLAVPFALVGFSFFIAWTIGNLLAGHGPLYSLTGVGAQKEKELAFAQYSATVNVAKWVWIFVQSPGPLVTGLALAALAWSDRGRRWPLSLAALSIMMMAPYWVLSVLKPEWTPQHRYVVLPAILLLPYAAAMFWHLFGRHPRRALLLGALFAISLGTQALAYGRHSSLYLPVKDYKASDVAVSAWLAANLRPEDRIVVEDLDWRSPAIRVRSGRWADMTVYAHEPAERLSEALRESGATVLVLHSDDAKWPFLAKMNPSVIYRSGEYRVLRIERATGAPAAPAARP
jgi:4-amino-4-deoxy-L-arabinose transferase-like glycosyltransferase